MRKEKTILVKRTDMPDYSTYCKLIKKLWGSKWITNNGVFAKELTLTLQRLLGVEHLVLLSNGTLPLHIALNVMNLPKGGEIITTPFTFVATTSSIVWEKFKPVFVDIDLETWNINPSEIEKAITSKTVAIMPVHVYGNPCYVEAIEAMAKKYNLRVIYDAAHAFGVKYKGKSVLNFGDFSSLSFHATKVFHTIEGGALATTDSGLYKKACHARNFGIVEFEEKYDLVGTNAKMNEFQAAMGLCNISGLNNNLQIRKKIYDKYVELLMPSDEIKFQKIIASQYNYSYMPVCFKSKKIRNRVAKALENRNVFPRKYFYPLINDIPIYKKYGVNSYLHNAKKVSDGILCLPLHGEVKNHDIKTICEVILKNL